jgi:hypothetical protein
MNVEATLQGIAALDMRASPSRLRTRLAARALRCEMVEHRLNKVYEIY